LHQSLRPSKSTLGKRILLAALVPLALLVLAEGVLALLHVADPAPFFVRRASADGELLAANPASPWGTLPFEPSAFPAAKPAGVYRIFCVGESTANGFPYARHSSFARWLRVRLATLLDGAPVEVVKMGYDAKSTQDLDDLCEEVVDYAPDLLVLYAGHNQFLPQNLGPVLHPWQHALRSRVLELRLARLLARWCGAGGGGPAREGPPKSVARTIDDEPYLAASAKAQGYALYRDGLARIARACARRGVQLLVCVPVSNLRDYAPNKSHWSVTGDARAEAIRHHREGAAARERGDLAAAAAEWNAALALDGDVALLHYEVAKVMEARGDPAGARTHYLAARDQDDLPNRATRENLRVLEEVLPPSVLRADCPRVFDAAAQGGIPGSDLFVDNCHPELRAQKLISDAILERMAASDLIRPRGEWHFDREPSLEAYWKKMGLSLPDMTTDFARDAIVNLIQLLGRLPPRELAQSTEDALRFGLRYDPENPAALLGLALADALRNDQPAARALVERSKAADPEPLARLQEIARKDPRLRALVDSLTDGQ